LDCMPSNMAKRRGPRTPVVLIVLDGWGFRPGREGNAVELGDTPTWHRLWSRAPRTLLNASGLAVGLPEGQIGNSEVGHLNLGAGRVVMQDLVRIGAAIANGSFFQIPALVEACDRAKDKTLHLIGLIGEGGVHAHDDHLIAMTRLADDRGVKRVVIHGMLDGRDAPPRSGLGYMEKLMPRLAGGARFASIGGRYFG